MNADKSLARLEPLRPAGDAAGKKNIIAVIPARGGSRGIPGKNLRLLAGMPLIGRAIVAAKSVAAINVVIVSTDSDEIAYVASSYGALVVRRPACISGDTSRSEEAIYHSLIAVENDANLGTPEIIVFIQCTAPLMLASDIQGTIDILIRDKADCAFAAAPFHHFVWIRDDRLGAVGVNHERDLRQMRQERRLEYIEAGSVYAMSVSGFRIAKHRFFGRVAIYQIPESRCLEIDDMQDFDRAEAILKSAMHEKGLGPC